MSKSEPDKFKSVVGNEWREIDIDTCVPPLDKIGSHEEACLPQRTGYEHGAAFKLRERAIKITLMISNQKAHDT